MELLKTNWFQLKQRKRLKNKIEKLLTDLNTEEELKHRETERIKEIISNIGNQSGLTECAEFINENIN